MQIPVFMDDALGFNLYQAHLLVRRELQKVLLMYSLTPEQWTILAILWFSEKPLKQSEIVHLTLRDKYTTSKIIRNLERDGWVNKQNDPDDARSTLISLTKKSNNHKDEIISKVKDSITAQKKMFNPEEINELIRLLKKLRANMGADA